jgi:hypothetical protein
MTIGIHSIVKPTKEFNKVWAILFRADFFCRVIVSITVFAKKKKKVSLGTDSTKSDFYDAYFLVVTLNSEVTRSYLAVLL